MTTLSSPLQIPDQTGRTVVVTGGASGIGLAAAAALAARGAHVILAVRDSAKGRAAARAIGGHSFVGRLDLASQTSIREFAGSLRGPIDVLVNNAGFMTADRRQTEDGFESHFGVNHLGHFALTNLLLDRITGRVVTVSSTAYRGARLDFSDLQWERRPYRPFAAYGQSKLANLLFTAELQRRLAAAGSPVIAAAVHPGWASTGFRMTSGNRLLDALVSRAPALLAHGPEGGALPTLLAATGDIPAAAFLGPSRLGGMRGPAGPAARSAGATDAGTAARLWDVSEGLTGVRFPLTGDAAVHPQA